jgi:hypothetical protein
MCETGIRTEIFEKNLDKKGPELRVNRTLIGNQLLVTIWVTQNHTRIGSDFQNHHQNWNLYFLKN